LPDQHDPDGWAAMRERFAALFRTRTQAQWCELLEDTDVCFAPVLSLTEAPMHPHNLARGTFTAPGGVTQPAPAPRFSRTPGSVQSAPAGPGEHTDEVLGAWLGLDQAGIDELRAAGAVV
jgi:alpha-methylacyl-CoA racemase